MTEESNTLKSLTNSYNKLAIAGKQHHEKMVNKYGKENVKSISTKSVEVGRQKVNLMNERTSTTKSRLGRAAINIGSVVGGALGSPVGVYVHRQSANSAARELYRDQKKINRMKKRI